MPFTAAHDARNVAWRCRVQLYDVNAPMEPAADSDPELAPDQISATTLAGLNSVAAWLAVVADQFHGPAMPVGLDTATLARKLKSLRVDLSRRGGNAVWRVPYTVNGARWLARVNVERAT